MKTINTQLHKNNGCALAALGLALAGTQSAQAHAVWGNISKGVPTKTIQAKTDQALGRTLSAARQTGWTAAIVKTTGPITAAQQATLTNLGADITRHLPIIQSVSLRVPTHNLERLAALPFVSHLSYDGQVKKCDEFTVGSSGAGTAYQQYGLDGTGITVAVVDSGIGAAGGSGNGGWGSWGGWKTGNDLTRDKYGNSGRLMASVDYSPTDSTTSDDCGHGTHVAGIIAGNGSSSTGYQYYRTFYGIARNANLVSVKVLDSTGQSDVSTVISGIQWVVSNKSKYNIRVLNLSSGHAVGESYKTDPLCQAVEAAWKAGIVVVCAAGNAGRMNAAQASGAANEGWGTAYGSIISPGNDPYVITVGATKNMDGNRAHDRIATYSSRGPSRLDMILKPDIIAPGNQIISTDADNSYLDDYDGGTNDIPLSAYMYGGRDFHVPVVLLPFGDFHGRARRCRSGGAPLAEVPDADPGHGQSAPDAHGGQVDRPERPL